MINLRIILVLKIFVTLISCSNSHDLKRIKMGDSYVEAHFIDSTSIDGMAKYYDSSGVLTAVINYRDGIKIGVAINYYPNGAVLDSVEYIAGKESGYWKGFDEKGNIVHCNFNY